MVDNKKTSKKQSKSDIKKRDKEEWLELCAWIELNIFEYTPQQKLQRKAVLVLDGLRKGQMVANNNCDQHGEYSMKIILLTFKANKTIILNALRGKEFPSEEQKMKYVCAIVRDKLNDMYTRYLNAQKSEEHIKNIDTNIMTHKGAEYKSKQSNVTKEKFKEMW